MNCSPMIRAATLSGIVALTACSAQSPVAPNSLGAPFGQSGAAAQSAPKAPLAISGSEWTDILNQGGGGVYAPNGAQLVRQPSGLRASITMRTPEPGTYVYAPGRTDVGQPEVFTLWAFVFNYPDQCIGPCDGNDIGANTAAKGGVYNAGGHAASGNMLTIAGQIAVGDPPLAPSMAALESPGTAEIHLAVAPHGALDPARLPDDYRLPTGSPTCGCWWLAFFR
jgi:hypothetical protein